MSSYNENMCWYCGEPIADAEPIGRSLRCQTCGKDLRCCLNCRFFAPASAGAVTGDCQESHGEVPAEKDRANFCDWFSLDPKRRQKSVGRQQEKDAAKSARSAFDNLFAQ